ncbi:M23 family metallopeptidase [Mycobacterium sp. OTB74]|uniref:M23 family metallopeptidase n=1 Tax=Mycobacterium sp. OTB74 TaxID=1853452 RepID=UPI0024730F33|nr:M23 family metallopeptidase [Mycobacterium sp. OTB74]MDH6245609.1 murein DD-endopeptidase MepM/ murein hydrolase activator NlpD [Mycobacterium sp. OTB74]
MAEHDSSAPPQGEMTKGRKAGSASPDTVKVNRAPVGKELSPAEVTDIIPFNEFGSLHDLDLSDKAFDRDSQVNAAPELDDLDETDDQTPFELTIPAEFQLPADARRLSSGAYRESHTDTSNGFADTDVIDLRNRRGSHRKAEPTVGGVKGRLVAAAVAAGATAAAAYSMATSADQPTDTKLAAEHSPGTTVDGATGATDGIQIVNVTPVASNTSVHAQELANAAAFAQERAEREARLARPLFVMPTKGVFTSGFGYRWGALHGGIDLAAPIGTPIVSISDGVVVDVGPTAGYGAWVKVRHSDGTVTLYGHVNTWTVSVGQRVMAGDQIATVGNRGNSTGPHCHFEVLLGGTHRIDPVPWLAERGLSPGAYVG